MSEIWRAVVGHEGFYEVSSYGRVRSIDRVFIRADGQRQGRRGRVLTPSMAGRARNYPYVTLRLGKRKAVHVLVCEAFHGPRPTAAHEVAHWDGNPNNNRAANLRWATRAENSGDARRHGTYPLQVGEGGELNGHARLTWADVDAVRAACASGATPGVPGRALRRRQVADPEHRVGQVVARGVEAVSVLTEVLVWVLDPDDPDNPRGDRLGPRERDGAHRRRAERRRTGVATRRDVLTCQHMTPIQTPRNRPNRSRPERKPGN